MSLTAFLFVGREGPAEIEQWVMGGRVAAARDAVQQLARLPQVSRIVVVTNAVELSETQTDWPVLWDLDPAGAAFHFGRRLTKLLDAYPARAHAYFGAGSAPLLADDMLAEAVNDVTQTTAPHAVANNLLSSDWLVFNCAEAIQGRPERLERDNMLGPVLKYEAGVNVRGLAAGAATRADIDTPADLLALSLHPHLKPALAGYLRARPRSTEIWRAAGRVLSTDGSRITLIGRVSSAVWSHIEDQTRCWTRVFSEERGMAASGRQAAGQVKSLVAAHLAHVGVKTFFAEMSEMAEAVFLDTRVLLAHFRRWPSAADRYASDAGQPELIRDEFLREFTEAALNAPMPVVLGGHGVVAGDLYALMEATSGST